MSDKQNLMAESKSKVLVFVVPKTIGTGSERNTLYPLTKLRHKLAVKLGVVKPHQLVDGVDVPWCGMGHVRDQLNRQGLDGFVWVRNYPWRANDMASSNEARREIFRHFIRSQFPTALLVDEQ